MNFNKILVVLGEPNSIFSEVLFKYFNSKSFKKNKNIIIMVGNKKLIFKQMRKLRYDFRIKQINSIKKAGGRITGGSDWTVSSLNPLVAMEVAVTRKEPGKKNGESLIPEEAVTLETILNAYTLEAAYGLFLDDKIGSIEVGKLADIVVLDRNLFKIPKHEIHSTKVNQTIFNGKIVYEKD